MGDQRDLSSEAERLADEAGPEPEPGSPERPAWQARWDAAVDYLVDMAGGDGACLRAALGPPVAVAESTPGRNLLVLAALACETRMGFGRLGKPPGAPAP